MTQHHALPPAALMVDLQGLEPSPEETEFLGHPLVGGVILFARNYREPSQLRDLTARLRELRPELLLAVDQEGGRVQRFRDGFLPLPSPARLAAAAREQDDDSLLNLAGWAMAAEVLHHGLDFSFAPVLDLDSGCSAVIGDRAFAPQPDEAAAAARAYIGGMRAAGMAATGKHFPGHGSVAADSHAELPRDSRSREEILEQDCQVFARCLDLLDGVMPAHVVYPAVDRRSAGFSPVWLEELLRRTLGFAGAVFSDDLSMVAAAAAGSCEARAEMALTAGCDMLLVCNDGPAARRLAKWLDGQADAALRERLRQGRRRQLAMVARPAAGLDKLYELPRWREARERLGSLAGEQGGTAGAP